MSEKTTFKTDRPIVFFDNETTGTDYAKDRICQIAIIKLMPDGSRQEKKALINPTIPIPPEATEVHGITDDMISDKPTFKQLSKSLYGYIQGCDFGGYNINRFDLPMLIEEFYRSGIEPDFDDVRLYDLMVAYKKLYPRDLSSCYKHYTQKDLDGAHDAMVDTAATEEIFFKMLENEEKLKGFSLDQLNEYINGDENRLDLAGKFVRNDSDEIVFNFGKHKGEPCVQELGFIDWMLNKDFSKDTLKWAKKIKSGEVK